METPLRVSRGCWPQLKFSILFPAFFFVFIFFYDPFSFRSAYDLGGRSWTFHLMMMTAIMIGVIAISRLVFFFLYKYLAFKWWHYIVWCIGEVVVTALFFALYTSLFHLSGERLPFFAALPYCLEISFLTMTYPYLFSILVRIIENKDIDIEDASKVPEDALLKLYDEHKRLKLTIDPSAILYVNAEANYINIHFLENDRVRSYLLRNSMKSFEPAASAHGLVRCHRSYFVNPRHVKVLSRDKDGIIYTEFIREGVGRIPVSKMYYDSLAKML